MKKIYILAAALLSLTACVSNEDNPENPQLPVKISATIGDCAVSRAVDDSWEEGDEIGISSIVGSAAGPFTNLLYTTESGTSEFKGPDIYYYRAMTLKAYYPFTGQNGKEPGVNGIIEANTRAANQAGALQRRIDFLWDVRTNLDQKDFSASNTEVNFQFNHKMSKLMFSFIGSDEVVENGTVIATKVEVSDIVRYEIEGLVMDGNFDTTTGICSTKIGADPEMLSIAFDKGTVKDNEYLSPLIVFPQKPGNNSVKLHVYTDEIADSGVLQHYICSLSFGDGELKPGNCYKYTIQISKVGLKLKQMSIIDWNTERKVNLTATIDGGVNK